MGLRLLRLTAAAQGAYYLVTGLWPWMHLRSFEAIAGPKTDDWLVQSFGLVIAVVGVVLLYAARYRSFGRAIVILGVGCALALGFVSAWFALRDVVWDTYLLDAAAEATIVAGWAVGLWNRRTSAST